RGTSRPKMAMITTTIKNVRVIPPATPPAIGAQSGKDGERAAGDGDMFCAYTVIVVHTSMVTSKTHVERGLKLKMISYFLVPPVALALTPIFRSSHGVKNKWQEQGDIERSYKFL